ncbi:response regulator transcription factor [Candidatus Microgenomates bacterium]|nr:response regulator transcription factor [Candidatus Microgenomates bacterium]
MRPKILIVEDHKDLQEYLRLIIVENGYTVESAYTGSEAIKALNRSLPDLVLLDLGLPDISGETLCKDFKKKYPDLSIIILTARDTTDDVVHGLDLGADDYIAKPFQAEELLARLKARLRQIKNSSNTPLRIDDLELDGQKVQVKRGSQLIDLTQKEFMLLEYLMRNKGQVLSREMILDRVWAYSNDVESRVVDVYIGYLRKKIDGKSSKKLIHSVRGFGYVIKD